MACFYRFGDIEVDLEGFRVLKSGGVISLEPKAFSVLVYLIDNRGKLIEKRALLDAVWGDAFVTENVLTRVIAQLRKVLADDSKDARYIETVPTRGYRFVADVSIEERSEGRAVAQQQPVASIAPVADGSASAKEPRRAGRRTMAWAAVFVLAGIVAGGFFAFRVWLAHQYLQVVSAAQITTSSGLSFYPTFSPDASEIVYSTDRGKGFEIFRRPIAPGGKEFQITSDGNQNMQAAWSPDGSLIAYYSRTRGGIWLIPSLGGTVRQLTEFGSHPSWSRDGQWIAFQSAALDDLGSDSNGVNPPSSIWIVHPDGSNPKQITQTGQPDGGNGAPSWSPDGRHIVFVDSLRGSSELWAVNPDGSGLVRLAKRLAGYFDPIYTPDGTSVLYGSAASGKSFGLWQVRVSPDTSAALGAPVQIHNSGGGRFKNLAISPDGKRLVYADVGLLGSLHSLSMSKSFDAVGEPVTLTSDVGCRNILPMFSPDGSRLAFTTCHGRAGVPQQIWSMNPDGTNLQQLTFPPLAGGYDTWYPDSRRILVRSRNKLLSVDVDTHQQKVIMEFDQPSSEMRMSPDGSQVVLVSDINGIQNLSILDMASGKQKQLTFEKEMGDYPSWSPNGKFIAYESERDAANSIAIVPANGGTPEVITPYQGQHWLYSWSPDSDKVIYAKPNGNMIWDIWAVSRTTKVEKQLTHYTKSNSYVRYPDMSRRGDQIVYEYTESTGNIWMLELK